MGRTATAICVTAATMIAALAGGAAIAGAMYALWPSPTAMQAAVTVGPGQAGWTLRGSF